MKYLFRNNASGVLANEMSSLSTTFTVNVGQGANFPNPTTNEGFQVTLQTGSAIEIVQVNTRVGDVFTVTRGRENTTAQVWLVGTPVEMRLTQSIMEGFFQLGQEIVDFAKTMALGVTGKITGGTLENNTIQTAIINNPNLKTASVKPVDGNTTNAIVLPNGGGRPTIAGAEIITQTGGEFSGALTSGADVKGVTGTFGALVFRTGSVTFGGLTTDDTLASLHFAKDSNFAIRTNNVTRLFHDKTTRNWGLNAPVPLQAVHVVKSGIAVVYTRSQNDAGSVDMGINADGRAQITNSNTKGLLYIANGFTRLSIDDAGRMSVPGGNAEGTRTIATSDPTGGADGDIWLKV